MANAPEEAGKSPKDITPNPLDEAAKKTEMAEQGSADAAQPAAEQTAPQEIPEDPGPQNIKELIKESFIDSIVWNRILQLLLIVAGIYGLYLSMGGLNGQEFNPVPGVFGGLALTLASLFDIYIMKKFRKSVEKLEVTARIALAIVLGLMTAVFAVELFEKFKLGLPENKYIMLAAAVVAIAVFTVNFLIYVSSHREKILADIYMFISLITGFLALVIFGAYHVVISFAFALLSMMALIASLSNDTLKDDDRLKPRLFFTSVSIIMFLAILAYAATIFMIKPFPVITYGPVTDAQKIRPINLGWSGDSWSFDYTLSDKKKKTTKIGIVNALSLGITELPAKDQEKIKLPKHTDAAVWNKNGSSLIFTAAEDNKSPRNIWAVALNLSLVEQEMEKARKEKAEKEKAEKESKDKDTLLGKIKEELKTEAQELKAEEIAVEEKKLRTKEDDKLNKPVGKPKVLLADMNLAVDKDCKPITHKTAWSPDGRKFCFAANEDGNFNIWSADVKSQEIDRLTSGNSKIMPLWSPSGEKILFCTKTESYSYLKISDYNGKNARELNVNRERDRVLFPLWNSEESRVIYVKDNKFVVMHANATNEQPLSRESFPKSPYWMNDAKKKVKLNFTESGTIWKVWTMNTDGKKQELIFTEVCEDLAQPKWSYDGKSIALAANYSDEMSTVFRMNRDGSMKTKLYTTEAKVTEIEWANSSKRLAFLARHIEEKTEELWAIENDGTDPRALYETKGKLNNISWNDMGNRIAFDETIKRLYFFEPITVIKIAEAKGEEAVFDLLPYEFNGQYPTWSSDGQVLAYVSWNKLWTPGVGIGIGYGIGDRVWAAKLE